MPNSVPAKQLRKLLSLESTHPRLIESLQEFLNRAPKDVVDVNQAGIEYLDLGNRPHTIYKVPSNPIFMGLVKFGSLDDLSFSATVGLISHVFGLLHEKYYFRTVPKGRKWLEADLHSDQVARQWGFANEINELRKVRPQKIPPNLSYPDFVISFSATNSSFNREVQRALKELNLQGAESHSKRRIWYTDRYSMVCGLNQLREAGIDTLYVLTEKHTSVDLKDALTEILVQ